MSKTNTRFSDLEGTSRELNVPVTWLRSEALAGRIPCLRAGSRLLFHIATVELELIQRSRIGLQMSSESPPATQPNSPFHEE